MRKTEIIITIIVAIIGISGGVITHILYKSKLNKDLQCKSDEKILIKYLEAINKVREVIDEASIIEYYGIVHPKSNAPHKIKNDERPLIYPSIMEDRENWHNFFNKLSDARKEYDQWFDRETALYLQYAEKYYILLTQYIKENENWEFLYELGLLFIPDIDRWRRSFDKLLVEKLNQPKHKLEVRTGRKWKKLKESMESKWRNTILYSLLYAPDSDNSLMFNVVLEMMKKERNYYID